MSVQRYDGRKVVSRRHRGEVPREGKNIRRYPMQAWLEEGKEVFHEVKQPICELN